MGAYQNYINAMPTQPKLWFKFDSATSGVLIDSGTVNNGLTISGVVSYSTPSGGIDTNYLNITGGITYTDAATIIPSYLNYTIAWWWRRSTVGNGQGPFGWQISSANTTYAAVSGNTLSVESDGKFYYYSRHGGTAHSDLGPTMNICDNVWRHFAIVRNGTNVSLYINGTLFKTVTNAGTSFINDQLGELRFLTTGNQLDEWALWNYAMTATEVNNLYVHAPANVNRNFTTTPATASNANFPLPTVSTTTGVSFGAIPSVADADLLDASVSADVNFSASSIITTAFMAQTTLVFTFDDYVNIVTSVLVDAIFPPASVSSNINLSNAAGLMDATAEMPEHGSIAGQSIDFFAEEFLGNAIFDLPIQFGDPDNIFNAAPMLATNSLFNLPTIFVTPSYFNLIRRKNPAIYINGGLTNYGYAQPSTVQVQSSFTRAVDNPPMSYIFYDGSNNSYKYNNNVNGNEEVNVSGTGVTNAINAIHLTRNWTYEFWFKPNVENIRGWADTDSQTEIMFDSGPFQLSHTSLTVNLNQTILAFRAMINDGSLDPTLFANVPFTLIPTQNWHHFVITGQTNPADSNQIRMQMYVNGSLLNTANITYTPTAPANGNKFAFYPAQGEMPGLCSFDEAVLYPRALTESEILDHYNYIKFYDPSAVFFTNSATASAELAPGVVLAVQNINFPETPSTASCELVNPTVTASINISNSAPALLANSEAIEPFFYGDPDVVVAEPSMIATADVPQNIFRLDTAYYSYVQTNIAPFRYVTFDSPNSALDWGNDNDFGGVAPFTYAGSILSPINGLNNNSLLSDGVSYITSGLVMKESEHDDTWGTHIETWHTSFWIKKDITDTNPIGLRIIANLHSHENNKHLIVYQYNNHIYLQMDDKVHPVQTFESSVPANVFDGVKHHIVITSKDDNKIQIYKNKLLIMNANFGSIHVETTNSASYLAPNTEANNKARFSVGALITPYEETSLVAIPTASKLIIDEVHWAQTHINQTQVNNLNAAMPQRTDIEWFADPALSTLNDFVDPTFGTGSGINALPLEATNAELVLPTISTQIEYIFNADAFAASAEMVEPFSVIADNITNISIDVDPMFVFAEFPEPQGVFITFSGPTMYATARMASSAPYYDEYNLLILKQSRLPLGTTYAGRWSVGDVDS